MLSFAIALVLQAGAAPASEARAINAERLITPRDYPADAMSKNESGVVSIEVQVSPAGKPTGCVVTESSRSASLDRTSCQLVLRRLELQPARDASGAPTTGRYRTFMTWAIDPNRSPAVMDSSLTVAKLPAGYTRPVKLRLEFDASGHSDKCSVAESSGSASIDQVACRQARKDIVIPPPRPQPGATGRAVRFMNLKFVAK